MRRGCSPGTARTAGGSPLAVLVARTDRLTNTIGEGGRLNERAADHRGDRRRDRRGVLRDAADALGYQVDPVELLTRSRDRAGHVVQQRSGLLVELGDHLGRLLQQPGQPEQDKGEEGDEYRPEHGHDQAGHLSATQHRLPLLGSQTTWSDRPYRPGHLDVGHVNRRVRASFSAGPPDALPGRPLTWPGGPSPREGVLAFSANRSGLAVAAQDRTEAVDGLGEAGLHAVPGRG